MEIVLKGIVALLLSALLTFGVTLSVNTDEMCSEEPTASVSTIIEEETSKSYTFHWCAQKTTTQVVLEVIEEISEETTETLTTTTKKVVEKPNTTETTKKALTTIPRTEEKKSSKTKSLGQFKLTAYCSCKKCCGKYAENRPTDSRGETIVYGASGNKLSADRSIAVDTSIIPYGSKVIINGRTYVAEDCGGKVKGKHIDVYFDNHSKALEFGKKYAEVYFIIFSANFQNFFQLQIFSKKFLEKFLSNEQVRRFEKFYKKKLVSRNDLPINSYLIK